MDSQPADNRLANELCGFGPLGIIAILVIIASNLLLAPLGAVLVLVWVRLSHTPWRDIGYVRPKSIVRDAVVGIVVGVTFKFLMKAIVMPLLGADPVNHAYHYLTGNPAALPGAAFMMIVVAGWGEETLFRGYMFERLSKLFGSGTGAKTGIVLITSVSFAMLHYFVQGIAGVEQAMITGLVFGTIFAFTGSILLPMVVHAAFDLTAVAIIYWDLESRVAHWVFR